MAFEVIRAVSRSYDDSSESAVPGLSPKAASVSSYAYPGRYGTSTSAQYWLRCSCGMPTGSPAN